MDQWFGIKDVEVASINQRNKIEYCLYVYRLEDYLILQFNP